ncbi:MAG: hypothetical protein EXR72_10060 [Myxococcales bacterium]|nr:hypothetical protein [Myxococcales bacterium]
MRDLERWKDKVELSLDGRQIFFLFFGSAVAACLIFVAGMMVGKRVERRAAFASAPASEDPLAALDRLGDAEEADDGLTFHQALAPLERHSAVARVARPAAAKAAVAEKPAKPDLAERPAAKPEPVKPAPAAPEMPAKVEVAVKPDAAPPAVKPEVAPKHEVKPEVAARPAAKPEAVKPEIAAKPAGKPDGGGSRFTLQLSAFSERADAEQFLQRMQSAGYRPFLVQSDVPGRGLFYRVRVGDYVTRKAAAEAKTDFERKQHVIAYVAKL